MRIWGITGTNGKTTTAWIAAAFMRAAYITTVEVWTRRRRFSTGYTTPPLPVLKDIYAEMEAAGARDCVMEVSSHAIHQNRVGFGTVTTFAGGAFTNLSEDHLDYHKTMDEYFRVKLDFAKHLSDWASEHSSDGEDGSNAQMLKRSNAQTLKRSNAQTLKRSSAQMLKCPNASLQSKNRKISNLKSQIPYVICLDGEGGEAMYAACRGLPGLRVIPVTREEPRYDLSGLRLAGDYNKSNVLTAAALAEAAGVPRAEIQRLIPTLEPRWGRLEEVPCASRARVFVDFAHTPDGLEKVLSAARAFTPGRLWVVFGAGGDRDRAKRPLMGAVCARLADEVVVTSDNPRSEEPQDIIADILSGMGARREASHVEADRSRAIHHALAAARAGDVVLVCGKGHETTQEVKGVKLPFDDRAVVRAFAP